MPSSTVIDALHTRKIERRGGGAREDGSNSRDRASSVGHGSHSPMVWTSHRPAVHTSSRQAIESSVGLPAECHTRDEVFRGMELCY